MLMQHIEAIKLLQYTYGGKLNDIYISWVKQSTSPCLALYGITGQNNNRYYLRTFRIYYLQCVSFECYILSAKPPRQASSTFKTCDSLYLVYQGKLTNLA